MARDRWQARWLLASPHRLGFFAAACLLNALNLYIMAYIRKRDMARSEPLRTFFSAFAWTTLGEMPPMRAGGTPA